MNAWYDLIGGFLSRHPLLAPILLALWQAASHDLLAFLRASSWGEAKAGFDARRFSLTLVQGVLSSFVGQAVIAGGAAATGVALVLWGLR